MLDSRWLTAVTLAVTCSITLAQTTPSGTPKRVTTKPAPAATTAKVPEQPPAAPERKAPTGPTGIGSIKIGMTKEEVEAIPQTEAVALTSPLTLRGPSESYTPKPGEDRYDTLIKMPGHDTPLKASMAFKEGKLTMVRVDLEKAPSFIVESLERQITDRYAAPTVKDNRKEEDCIYRNGNSFKIKSGLVTKSWSTAGESNQVIETFLIEGQIAMCPSNLRHGMLSVDLRSLSVSINSAQPASAQPSIF